MINYIWFVMIFLGLIVGIFTGNGEGISNAIIGSIDSTVSFIIGLVGLMCFWCGVMKVAEKSGFTEKLAKLMKPILKLIFKESAKDEKALGAIVMNITANMMGLGNAATPFGIKAMEEMGTTPKQTWLFEDGAYSIETAKQLGIKTIGIYDPASEKDQEKIRNLTNIYIKNWTEHKTLLNQIQNNK